MEIEKQENLDELKTKNKRSKRPSNIKTGRIAIKSPKGIETKTQEIKKERIANLTRKLSIISKGILLPYFLSQLIDKTRKVKRNHTKMCQNDRNNQRSNNNKEKKVNELMYRKNNKDLNT